MVPSSASQSRTCLPCPPCRLVAVSKPHARASPYHLVAVSFSRSFSVAAYTHTHTCAGVRTYIVHSTPFTLVPWFYGVAVWLACSQVTLLWHPTCRVATFALAIDKLLVAHRQCCWLHITNASRAANFQLSYDCMFLFFKGPRRVGTLMLP